MRGNMRSFSRRNAVALALGVVVLTAAADAPGRPDITGYGKTHTVAYDRPDVSGGNPLWSSNNRARVITRLRPAAWLNADLAYDLTIRVQDERLFVPALGSVFADLSAYRVRDLDAFVYPDDAGASKNLAVLQNLDRLSLTFSAPAFDLIVGRQAVAWGSARAVNPTDVFAPYLYNEIDTEDRIGVDAVRLRVPAGSLGEVDVGYVGGEDFEWSRSAVYLRCKLHAAGTDMALLLADFRENALFGVDVTRALGGAGLWLEAAHVFVDGLGERSWADERADYLRVSVGADYNFARGIYTFLEYHFNDAGAKDPENYLTRALMPAYREGAVYLLGRHYVVPGVSFQPTPLVSVFGQVLFNITDLSALLAPMVDYNLMENLYLSAGAFAGLGKRSDTVLASTYFGPGNPYAGSGNLTIPLYRSEFGAYPGIYYVSLRFYY